MLTIFESGATTHKLNDVILTIDSTFRLSDMKSKAIDVLFNTQEFRKQCIILLRTAAYSINLSRDVDNRIVRQEQKAMLEEFIILMRKDAIDDLSEKYAHDVMAIYSLSAVLKGIKQFNTTK